MNKGMSRKQPAPPQPAVNPAKQRATSAEEEFVDDDVFLGETLFETEARHSPMPTQATLPPPEASVVGFQQLEIDNVIGESHREFLPNWSGLPSLSGFLGLQRKRFSVKMVAAGAEHTAAVTEDGSLYGRGWGNLGLGDRNDLLVLEKVSMKGKIPFYPLNPPTSLSRAYAVQNQGKNGGKKKREFGDFGGRATSVPGLHLMDVLCCLGLSKQALFLQVTARLRIYLITVLYGSINVLKGEGEAKAFHG
ncbi:unnamed protein product [Malus baccata var. baccata]